MILEVKFEESNQEIPVNFESVNNISDGGYERGYDAGYSKGHTDGEQEGYINGLAERKYETWTITLVDGSVVEKKVALI